MKIYDIALDMVESVCRLADQVRIRNKNLATQMIDACTSVPLNTQEGMYSRGGSKIARYHDSMASAKETMACLHVSVRARYLHQAQVDADLQRIDQVVAGLYRCCHKPRA